MSVFQKAMMKFAYLFFAKECKIAIDLCLSDKVKGILGKIFDGDKKIDLEFDKNYKDQLWEKSELIIGQILKTG